MEYTPAFPMLTGKYCSGPIKPEHLTALLKHFFFFNICANKHLFPAQRKKYFFTFFIAKIENIFSAKILASPRGAESSLPHGAPWVSGLGHFVQTWPDSECSHTVQGLDCSDLTLKSLSPVLARYDPFGVDVPLNFDNTHSLTPNGPQKTTFWIFEF